MGVKGEGGPENLKPCEQFSSIRYSQTQEGTLTPCPEIHMSQHPYMYPKGG